VEIAAMQRRLAGRSHQYVVDQHRVDVEAVREHGGALSGDGGLVVDHGVVDEARAARPGGDQPVDAAALARAVADDQILDDERVRLIDDIDGTAPGGGRDARHAVPHDPVVTNDGSTRREERNASAVSPGQGIVGDEVRLDYRRAGAAHLDAGAAEAAGTLGPDVPGDLVVRDQRRAEAHVDPDAVAASVRRDGVEVDGRRSVRHDDAAAREASAVGDGESGNDRAAPFAGVEGDDGPPSASIDDGAGRAGLARHDDRLAQEVDPFDVRPGR